MQGLDVCSLFRQTVNREHEKQIEKTVVAKMGIGIGTQVNWALEERVARRHHQNVKEHERRAQFTSQILNIKWVAAGTLLDRARRLSSRRNQNRRSQCLFSPAIAFIDSQRQKGIDVSGRQVASVRSIIEEVRDIVLLLNHSTVSRGVLVKI